MWVFPHISLYYREQCFPNKKKKLLRNIFWSLPTKWFHPYEGNGHLAFSTFWYDGEASSMSVEHSQLRMRITLIFCLSQKPLLQNIIYHQFQISKKLKKPSDDSLCRDQIMTLVAIIKYCTILCNRKLYEVKQSAEFLTSLKYILLHIQN